jgi:hypothetical protein
MRKTLFAILLALALVLIPAGNAFALTTADVDVTATPAILSISNTPDAWPINSPNTIIKSTTYYSNPGNETTDPGGVVLDSECLFTVTNNGQITADIGIAFPNFTGGAAWANSGTGSATTVAFGASAYVEGGSTPGMTLTVATVPNVIPDLAGGADICWGLRVATPTLVQTVGGLMTAVVVLTAEESL